MITNFNDYVEKNLELKKTYRKAYVSPLELEYNKEKLTTIKATLNLLITLFLISTVFVSLSLITENSRLFLILNLFYFVILFLKISESVLELDRKILKKTDFLIPNIIENKINEIKEKQPLLFLVCYLFPVFLLLINISENEGWLSLISLFVYMPMILVMLFFYLKTKIIYNSLIKDKNKSDKTKKLTEEIFSFEEKLQGSLTESLSITQEFNENYKNKDNNYKKYYDYLYNQAIKKHIGTEKELIKNYLLQKNEKMIKNY